MKWTMFPTGRWSTTVESYRGHIALHAWPGGEWAVTRGQASVRPGDPFVVGSRDAEQPTGKDLSEAMALAENAAREVVAKEAPVT